MWTSGPDLCPTENIWVSSGAFPKLSVQGIKHYVGKYLRIDCNMLSRLIWRHISSEGLCKSFIAGKWSRAMNTALNSGGMGAYSERHSCSKYPDMWGVWPLCEVGEPRSAGGLSPCHYPESDPGVVTSSPVWHHGQHIMGHVTGHSHPSQQTQSPIQPTSECRQQYLNLSSSRAHCL